MRILVAYDGSLQAKDALRVGIEKVKKEGGDITALHVFDNTLFYGYDAHPGAVEKAKREAERQIDEARSILQDSGKAIRTRLAHEEGDPEEEIVKYVEERYLDIILCPPRFKSAIARLGKSLGEQGRSLREDTLTEGTVRLKVAFVAVN